GRAHRRGQLLERCPQAIDARRTLIEVAYLARRNTRRDVDIDECFRLRLMMCRVVCGRKSAIGMADKYERAAGETLDGPRDVVGIAGRGIVRRAGPRAGSMPAEIHCQQLATCEMGHEGPPDRPRTGVAVDEDDRRPAAGTVLRFDCVRHRSSVPFDHDAPMTYPLRLPLRERSRLR